jgi:hypothetical protein
MAHLTERSRSIKIGFTAIISWIDSELVYVLPPLVPHLLICFDVSSTFLWREREDPFLRRQRIMREGIAGEYSYFHWGIDVWGAYSSNWTLAKSIETRLCNRICILCADIRTLDSRPLELLSWRIMCCIIFSSTFSC